MSTRRQLQMLMWRNRLRVLMCRCRSLRMPMWSQKSLIQRLWAIRRLMALLDRRPMRNGLCWVCCLRRCRWLLLGGR